MEGTGRYDLLCAGFRCPRRGLDADLAHLHAPTSIGKTTAHTDTYHGRFVKLVPNEQVVEVDEFETMNTELQGEMTISITFTDADGGTDLLAIHEGLPPGLSPPDNEVGWRMALAKLAMLVEANTG